MTRHQTLKDAATIASEAFVASTSTSTITIRALATFPGEFTTREPRLVFIGETTRRISALDLSQATGDEIQQHFSNLWWGTELPQ
jgi:hypothetical protein